ncbi:hypothetical protein BV25DRAFT_336449 [Artomyces pyxidatus]|uniref:Uncharacterized protein n=1 Tax=Artomyces pyxidatus TaxID=48021 RepID=A0ACB8T6D2_9AGAM|nr:hypothetical protein BV25DRAFT_336449 [Artomyces pyxidatus]
MVVTRRAPAAPASRTNSSQPIPRVSATKGKVSSHIPNVPDQSSPLANGKTREDLHHDAQNGGSRDAHGCCRPNLRVDIDFVVWQDDPLSKKNKNKSKFKKGGKKRKSRKASIADVLLRYLLLFFTIYSLTVCPNDVKLQSPVCRGLSEYRRLILEPYILPAINSAISHPAIAPYVDRATPYAERAVEIAKPIVLRTQSEWNHRVVPQWNKVIVPQYHKYVVPQYDKYLAPQVQRVSDFVEPYRVAVEQQYEKNLGPHVRFAVQSLNRFQRVAQPYVLLAADKSYTGYQRAKPYLGPVWQRVKATVRKFLIFLRVQRRKFVDPHVAKIWERVKELSSGEPKAEVPKPSPIATITPSPAAASVITSDSQKSVEETAAASPVPASAPPASASISASSVLTHIESTSETFVPPTASETLESVASVVSKTLHSTASTEPSITSSIEDVASDSTVASTESSTASSASSTASSATSLDSPSATPETVAADEIDLDALYAELGLVDDEIPEETETQVVEPEAPPAPPPLTEEELEELRQQKLAETAEKRRDITGRHTKWEQDLEALIKEKKKALRKTLVAMRKVAVQDLKTSEVIRGNVDNLVEEAEKFLKGAESYLKNLKKEGRKQEEKGGLWKKVVDKLEGKFHEHLRATEDLVNGWYDAHVAQEIEELKQITTAVSDLADSAQADIGMDYAWLDDVTYHDWQRYHDLVRTSTNFTELAQSIQNGSHPSPPINPILPALEELQNEVQDIIMGFETRLRRIRRSGDRAFGVAVPDGGEEEEEATEGSAEAPTPEVSILPIPGDQPEPEAPVLEEPSPIIGRGKAEVEEALARADSAIEEKGAEPLIGSAAEVSVGATSDVSTATAEPPVVSIPVHEEL